MAEIGQCVPSSLDLAYAGYRQWCQRLGYPAAHYDEWLRSERSGSGLSKATGNMGGMMSREESNRRQKLPPTLPVHTPTAAL
jgi:hypothetical protein